MRIKAPQNYMISATWLVCEVPLSVRPWIALLIIHVWVSHMRQRPPCEEERDFPCFDIRPTKVGQSFLGLGQVNPNENKNFTLSLPSRFKPLYQGYILCQVYFFFASTKIDWERLGRTLVHYRDIHPLGVV